MEMPNMLIDFDRKTVEGMIENDEILEFRKNILMKFESKDEYDAITVVFNELILNDVIKYRQYNSLRRIAS